MNKDGRLAARRFWIFGGACALALTGVSAWSCGGTDEQPTGPGGGTAGATATGGAGGAGGAGGGTVTGVTGGTLDTLGFAVVGDTRPPNADDTAGYPTAVITKIWQDVQAFSPRPPFAVTTGDYMFAYTTGTQVGPQLDLYLGARAAYADVVFPAMGNHECTSATASNCGTGNKDGTPPNYTGFMSKMLAPIGQTKPYYTVSVASTKGAWTAKLVFIAANAWDSGQAAWLDGELAKPTTYTFVIRHESVNASTAPGVTPSEGIVAKHPYTIKIVGHTHTYSYHPQDREVIVGNGGAPLTTGANYGYLIAQQRADGAMVFTAHDYKTNGVMQTLAVKADGTATN